MSRLSVKSTRFGRSIAGLNTRYWVVAAFVLFLVLVGGVAAQDIPDDPAERARREAETEQALVRLRRDVAALKTALEEGRQTESTAVAELARAERAVSDQGRSLSDLRERGEALQAELAGIDARRQQVEEERDRQREALAALLRLDYARSRQAPVKLLLDPDRIPSLARSLGYSRLVQRARLELLADQARALNELNTLAEEQAQALAALADQRAAVERQTQVLAAAVSEREQALAALRSDLSERQQRLAALAHDEEALQRLLEQLRDIFADLPERLDGAEPFRSLRGRLPWPVQGTPTRTENGALRIAADEGAEVQAIAHGRVAFADWLRGYGLLLIVDHGDGYMSLYGHNETLLKQEGAWVRRGERIAQVGRSGGEPRALLHFELRERGRSIDPRPWLQRR